MSNPLQNPVAAEGAVNFASIESGLFHLRRRMNDVLCAVDRISSKLFSEPMAERPQVEGEVDTNGWIQDQVDQLRWLHTATEQLEDHLRRIGHSLDLATPQQALAAGQIMGQASHRVRRGRLVMDAKEPADSAESYPSA